MNGTSNDCRSSIFSSDLRTVPLLSLAYMYGYSTSNLVSMHMIILWRDQIRMYVGGRVFHLANQESGPMAVFEGT